MNKNKHDVPTNNNMKIKKTKNFINNHRTALRIIIGVFAPMIIAFGVFILYKHGSPFKCFFYEVFNLYCPGCGSGRAARALVKFDFLKAISHNVFFILALPLVSYFFIVKYLKFVFNITFLPELNLNTSTTIIITISIIVFWIARNIPFLPFSILAP